jgi:hypothetical protein
MNIPTGTHFEPTFRALEHQHGVRIVDAVQDVQFHLHTTGPVSPTTCTRDTAPWCFPIDSACRLQTSEITVPIRLDVNIREPDGTLVESVAKKAPGSVDERGFYTVELTGAPIKLFLAANSRVLVLPSEHSTDIIFPDVDTVYLGARTLHKQPARTLTTTTDPYDLMEVISEFGAALKTTSCERSWPTLRGHPPLLEFGDSVNIPGGRKRPDTGVYIEVPPTPERIFPIASLAYYLGATVRAGPRPRLVTDTGFTYDLDGPEGFETTVATVLKHVFTMDCLTRCEGYYPVELHERQVAEATPSLDLDYGALYDAPLTEQLETYLSVPTEDVAPLAPDWRLTVDVPASIEHAEVLPHIAAELGIIRTNATNSPTEWPAASDHSSDVEVDDTIADFCRVASVPSYGADFQRGAADADVLRSSADDTEPYGARPARSMAVSQEDIFHIDPAESLTQTYIGDGFPIGANKASRVSYERQLLLRSAARDHIRVTVVCNDGEMTEEIGVGDHYGTRDLFEFDVGIEQNLTRSELRAVFESDADLVHYIGHVDSRGLQCADGYLDVDSITDVNVSTFILNGCRSFRQGERLVDAGAVGGIVTLENVHNSIATELGHHIARLLNDGWPLDGALNLVKDDALAGRNYLVVGDGSAEIVTPDTGVPTSAIIEPVDIETFEIRFYTFPTRSYHLGSIHNPLIADDGTRYLVGGETETFTVSVETLAEFFEVSTLPVQVESERHKTTVSLRWSDDLGRNELETIARAQIHGS